MASLPKKVGHLDSSDSKDIQIQGQEAMWLFNPETDKALFPLDPTLPYQLK
jgi:hypothetical protein